MYLIILLVTYIGQHVLAEITEYLYVQQLFYQSFHQPHLKHHAATLAATVVQVHSSSNQHAVPVTKTSTRCEACQAAAHDSFQGATAQGSPAAQS